MKKYIRLFIIVMAAIFIMPNVNAREFTIDNYNFSVEGVKINLYKVEMGESGLNTETLENYVLKKPTKVVNIDYTKFNYSPKYKKITTTYDDGEVEKTAYINLDFGITKEMIANYLKDEIQETTENDAYVFDVVLQIKFTSMPSNVKDLVLFTSSSRFSFARQLEMSYADYDGEEILDKNKTNDYVFTGGFMVNKELTFDNHALVVEPDSADGSEFVAFLQDTTINVNVTSFPEFIDMYDADENHLYGFVLLDYEDFDDFVSYIAEEETNITIDGSGDLKEVTYDTIPVPNTALDFSKVIYVFGYLLIIGGAYLLLRFKTKKGSN